MDKINLINYPYEDQVIFLQEHNQYQALDDFYEQVQREHHVLTLNHQ